MTSSSGDVLCRVNAVTEGRLVMDLLDLGYYLVLSPDVFNVIG